MMRRARRRGFTYIPATLAVAIALLCAVVVGVMVWRFAPQIAEEQGRDMKTETDTSGGPRPHATHTPAPSAPGSARPAH
jgi:hypothetical protein